jgi:hypothetical protein
MRRLQILTITPSTTSATPSSFTVGLNNTQLFHGQEWISGAGVRSPFYTFDTDTGTATPPPPTGTGVLLATSFEVVESTKYNGRYTVYTKPNAGGFESSELVSGDTLIRVNEAMDAGTLAETTSPGAGFITNISTYLLTVTGESSILLLEQQNKQDRPVELMGHRSSGWGEVMFQNMLRQSQSYAGTTAPTNPFLGQLWFDTTLGLLKIREISGWSIVNSSYFGLPPFRYTQAVANTTWTVPHNLALSSPFICSADFFVNIGAGVYKPILPSDVTFTNANSLTATFSTAFAGFAIIRA